MNRRGFIRSLFIGAAATVVPPVALGLEKIGFAGTAESMRFKMSQLDDLLKPMAQRMVDDIEKEMLKYMIEGDGQDI